MANDTGLTQRSSALISVLRRTLASEQEKIRRAEEEIFKLKMELLELGVELPLSE